METNQQTNCYNCSRPLPQTGYFCGGCLTQIKCKSCGSSLEKDDAGCVICGTPKEVRAETKADSHQNINTFRLHETPTDRIIEATFSDDVAKDLTGTLRDAAAAGRMRAIASSFPPNGSNGTGEETTEFADAEIVNNENGVPQTETISKPVPIDTVKPEEYPAMKYIVMNNLPSSEVEWIIVYAFYSSNFGETTFTRKDIISKYEESGRKTKQRVKNLTGSITNAVKGKYINPINDEDFSIITQGIEKAKEIIARTSGSSSKPKSSSKTKKVNEDNTVATETVNGKKASKSSTSKTLKRLNNINFEPAGKESLKDFITKYAPKNDKERNLLFVHYLQSVLEIGEITFDHIYSCYDILDLRISENLPQTIRNTASRTGWIETKNAILSVTIKGNNQIKAWNKKD